MPTGDSANPLTLAEDRFARFRRIDWWDQARLAKARVLVVGAGALGNEVLKNLALLGVGQVAIVDMDRVEESNLSRSVLFRPADQGKPKAEVAAKAMQELYPGVAARALVGNVLGDVGLGWFRWAEVIVGALDNREARLFVNSASAMLGRPWIDGGIEVLDGIVRGFAPPQTACYECTMGAADWREVNRRRSCSLLARRAAAEGGVPTTPTTASVIGAMQAQEVVKRLHGLDGLAGAGFVFKGLGHDSYRVEFPIHPNCPWHDEPSPVEAFEEFNSQTPLAEIWRFAAARLGGEPDAIDLARELVARLKCPACGREREVFRPLHRVTEAEAVCEGCGSECVPELLHTLGRDSAELRCRTPAEIGLPPWDVLWARRGEETLGMELAGDGGLQIAG
jgi:molybdopterin/thiamine biosynthesis adenylyltransferase